jgi:hypothetical protein
LALVSLLALGGPAFADLCTIDDVPAATLLLPYFEVDVSDPQGVNTLFSVNNATAAPVLAHVTLWTDLSIATLDFDLYLTGYDVQTFSVRDIFNGVVPQTGPSNALSPLGAFSAPHSVPASCAGGLPVGNPGAALVTLINQAHTGDPVAFFGGQCAGVNFGDGIVRGYITVDVVEECSTAFPNTPGYFDTIAGFDNVIWGDYFYVDPSNNFAQGETLVHVEADPAELAFAPGDYTFYGRYVAFTAVDQREPLPSIFATRFINGGLFTGGTDLICWRDSKSDPSPFVCGTLPPPFPLSQTQVVIFDEQENPELVEESRFSPGEPGVDVLACPWEAQRSEIGGIDFPVTPTFGWLYLNLNTTIAGAGLNPFAQAWVTAVMDADTRFSVGFDAIQLNDLCAPFGPEDNLILPVLPPA